MTKGRFCRRFEGCLPIALALFPIAALIGCAGEEDSGPRELTSVRLGPHGVVSTRTWTVSAGELRAMVDARRALSKAPASAAAPSRPAPSFGPDVLAQAVEGDCNSWDTTWVSNAVDLTGQVICLEYAPDEGPPMGTNEPFRLPWNVRSFATGNAAAMFCDRRFGSSCEWFSHLGLPFGERACRMTYHGDFSGPDHPQNPIWVQAQPLGEGCELN